MSPCDRCTDKNHSSIVGCVTEKKWFGKILFTVSETGQVSRSEFFVETTSASSSFSRLETT